MSLVVHRAVNERRAARISAANSTAVPLFHQVPDPRTTRRGVIGRATRLAHNRSSTYDLPFYFPPNVTTDFVLPVMPHGVTREFAMGAIGAWLENYRGIVKKRNANNSLAKYRMKLKAGLHPPRRVLCIDSTHESVPTNFMAGSTNNETEKIGYWFQICKDLTQDKKPTHFIYLTPPLTDTDILADNWLWASLEFRKQLAPVSRESKRGPAKKTHRRRRGKQADQRLSPEVLPDTSTASSFVPPTLTRSPSERSDTETGSSNSSTARASCASAPSHRNASPPTPPADVSVELPSDEEILSFSIPEYNREVARRRKAGLPSAISCQEVDIDVRFFLPNAILDTTLAVNKMGRARLANDEDFLFHKGFPKDLTDYLWMLVPYTEPEPIWQKVEWTDSFSVGGALSIQFQVGAKPIKCD